MSRLYDTIEPSVIDEKMLKEAVEDQGPKGEAGRIAKMEGIDFDTVLALRLDYRNILKIDNMWNFVSLTKLQMDNNIIEKIEGLDKLVNLEWLDLSFNNIEVIEGLDSLVNLRDLTLFNNRITRIENMENLVDLHVLSIGNNNIKGLENVVYLRHFKNLKTLNLNGNLFCEDTNYRAYVVAHLSHLIYLDFRLIDSATREAALEQYRYAIEELVHNETLAQKQLEESQEEDKKRKLHKDAYVEDLDGGNLFDSMLADDPEASKLGALPGVEDIIAIYKEKFLTLCQEMFSFGLKEHQKREEEINTFFTSIGEAREENKNQGVKCIAEYLEYKKKVFQEIANLNDNFIIERLTSELNDEIMKMWDTLMGLELQLVDQLEETIKDFERNLADMYSAFLEQIRGHMTQMRDIEASHNEKLQDIAVSTLEKLMKNELVDELPDEVRMLFVDKDTVMSAVSSSHESRLSKIDNKEDEICTRANQNMQSLIENIHSDEVKRNRKRVAEINNLLDHFRDDIESYDIAGPI